MNKYQLAVTPGTPEAKRAHCSCSGETYSLTNTETGEVEEGFLYAFDCKLHGLNPADELPPSI